MRKSFVLALFLATALTGCKYKDVTRETGYKGKARVNPWLAAERFCEHYEGEVRSLATWSPPEYGDSLWVAPASVLGNEGFVREVEGWVEDGGHVLLLVENTGTGNDWNSSGTEAPLEPAVVRMLERAGIVLSSHERRNGVKATRIDFDGASFEVDAQSASGVRLKQLKNVPPAPAAAGAGKTTDDVFASVLKGEGRLSVLTDGKIFRNRWIGDKDHAAFLDALVRAREDDEDTGVHGNIAFVRGGGLSLWTLLGDHLWPLLLGLGLLVFLWLWKSFARFGPVESALAPSPLRAYDHHLEALGDFQWRLDRASSLLAPLRAQIVERGQRMAASIGRRDDDFFQVIADLAGIPRERAFRALAEVSPADPATLTRTSADLQRMLHVLH